MFLFFFNLFKIKLFPFSHILLAAEDFDFIKSLSKVGIFTIIKKYDMNINVRRFLNTDAWTLGVVMDLRCHNESAVAIFAEVNEYIIYFIPLVYRFNNAVSFPRATRKEG